MPSGLRGRFCRYSAKEFFSGVVRVYPSGSVKRVLTESFVVWFFCCGGGCCFLSQDWSGRAVMVIIKYNASLINIFFNNKLLLF